MATPLVNSVLKIGNNSLFIASGGDPAAKAMIFIHGLGVSGRYFYQLAEELSADFQVVVVDLPGFGRSSKPKHALNISDMGSLIWDIVTALELDNPVLVGHSMGCEIAIEALAARPERDARCILLAPTVERTERTAYMQIVRLLQNSFHEPFRLNLMQMHAYVQCGLPRFLRTLAFVLQDTPENKITKLSCPVLLMRGSRDPLVSEFWVRELLKKAGTQSSFITVLGAAHAFHYKVPGKVAAYCREFIGAEQ